MTKVLFEPVRSAEPPISSGMALNTVSRASPEDWRVASAGWVETSSFSLASRASKAPVGRSPAMARVKSSRWAWFSRRASHDLRVLAPCLPTLAQAFWMPSGRSKGSKDQCRA
ncbi:hypothetical protein D3C72_1159310 [compost metagenome]